MSNVDQQSSLLARQAIDALGAEFAWLIDHCSGEGVPELFTEDGVYDMGGEQVFNGRDEIAHFYTSRKSRGQRTARHVFTNLHVHMESETVARCVVILTLYACDGAPPYPTTALMIADYEDVCVRGEDGRWRYRSRAIAPAFGAVPQLAKKPGKT
jgi:hypothetical protein